MNANGASLNVTVRVEKDKEKENQLYGHKIVSFAEIVKNNLENYSSNTQNIVKSDQKREKIKKNFKNT